MTQQNPVTSHRATPPASPPAGTAPADVPAARQSAAHRAYTLLRERILDGTLPGGTLISEGQIADELAVSRTPVREAFLRLQAEGWMDLFPKRGALVRPVQPGEIAEVIEARQIIESAAAEKVCRDPAAASDLAAHLIEVVAEQSRAAAAGDLSDFARADADFHQGIVDAGDNSILREVYLTLRDRQQRMTASSLRARTARFETIVDQHAHLVRLVAGQDAAGFATALSHHMHDIHRDLLR